MPNRRMADAYAPPMSDIGIFEFAKKTAALFVPMGIVAGLFATWLRGELLIVRQDMNESISKHEHIAQQERISRVEFEAFRVLVEDRFKGINRLNEEQSKMIQRNTVLLERISQKLGISRPPE